MAKVWHIVIAVGFVVLVGVIAAVEGGVEPTLEAFLPLIVLLAIGAVAYFTYRILRHGRAKGPPEGIRGGISSDEAEFIAASHLLSRHGMDIFAAGDSPGTAKYTAHMIANRYYPSPGEEAWSVRLVIRDRRHFQGFLTKVIIYIDGTGKVTGDFLMNELTFIDNDLWRRPEIYFIRGVSKTAKPRSLSDIVARYLEETGEFPGELAPFQVERILRKGD